MTEKMVQIIVASLLALAVLFVLIYWFDKLFERISFLEDKLLDVTKRVTELEVQQWNREES